jgi:hypothetical protein
MNNLKNDFLQSIVCTAVFAAVFGIVVACGRGNLNMLTRNTTKSIRLVNHLTPNMVVVPNNLNPSQPFMASFFQASPQPSQIQQSFEGQSYQAGENPVGPNTGITFNQTNQTTGFIPLCVPGESFIQFGPGATQLPCQNAFAQIGSGPTLFYPGSPTPGTLTNPGTPVYFDGTLTTLIVTGRTMNGSLIRCSDITTTVQVHDQDLVQPYFVLDSNSVILGIGTTQLPFTCDLNIPAGDQAGFLFVQWAKI